MKWKEKPSSQSLEAITFQILIYWRNMTESPKGVEEGGQCCFPFIEVKLWNISLTAVMVMYI